MYIAMEIFELYRVLANVKVAMNKFEKQMLNLYKHRNINVLNYVPRLNKRNYDNINNE